MADSAIHLGKALRLLNRRRFLTQAAATLGGNAALTNFLNGTIYQGTLKQLCLPGLNCYSCPGALGACPLGSLQNGLADPLWRIPLYVLGFLTLAGVLGGRWICGWLCPFGWLQELVYKLPGRKWRVRRERRDPSRPWSDRLRQAWAKWGSHSKTVILGVFVVAIPLVGRWLTGYGIPAFCTYICPSGTAMAGLPLLLARPDLRALASWLFGWKALVLALFLYLASRLFRPFCRYACPLGAIYGYFNRISLVRLSVDWNACTHCRACARACPMEVALPEQGNGGDCIRCGICSKVCPQGAIRCGIVGADRGDRIVKAEEQS